MLVAAWRASLRNLLAWEREADVAEARTRLAASSRACRDGGGGGAAAAAGLSLARLVLCRPERSFYGEDVLRFMAGDGGPLPVRARSGAARRCRGCLLVLPDHQLHSHMILSLHIIVQQGTRNGEHAA